MVRRGHSIENMAGMLDRLGPKFYISLIGPHNHTVQHDRAGPGHHSVDRSFTYTVHMVSIWGREVKMLSLELAVSLEVLTSKWVIISTELLDFNTAVSTELL